MTDPVQETARQVMMNAGYRITDEGVRRMRERVLELELAGPVRTRTSTSRH
jgi:hypothetical protein